MTLSNTAENQQGEGEIDWLLCYLMALQPSLASAIAEISCMSLQHKHPPAPIHLQKWYNNIFRCPWATYGRDGMCWFVCYLCVYVCAGLAGRACRKCLGRLLF